MSRRTEDFWMWVARHLPRPLRYWTTVLSCAEATQGKYSNTVVTELKAMDVLKRIDSWHSPERRWGLRYNSGAAPTTRTTD